MVTEDLSNIIDAIDELIINNKIQMIELTENDNQGREDEEVECDVKPDTSTTFIRYTSLSLWLIRKKMIGP